MTPSATSVHEALSNYCMTPSATSVPGVSISACVSPFLHLGRVLVALNQQKRKKCTPKKKEREGRNILLLQ
jgi:hypothetical protein